MKIANISPISTKLPFGSTQLFSYLVPEEMEDQIQVGSIVEIPLGTRVVKGVVFKLADADSLPLPTSPSGRGRSLKPIKCVIPNIQLNQYQLDLAMWMHRFYHAPLGIILKFVIPEIPTKQKEISNFKFQILKKYQISNIKYQIFSNQNERFEKYIELIEKYKKQNRQILILVPQIIDVETLYIKLSQTNSLPPLTPPSGRGGKLRITKLHSQLNKTEYFNNWAGFQSGEIDVLIGTRQAVLSPPSNLGLIIIDEPQDENFKQADQTPRFSAVEVAKKVAKMMEIELAMGSSAPEVGFVGAENFQPLQRNISIIDSQNEFYGKNFSPLSNKLQDLLQETVENKKWAMLLVNRRGESSFIICKDCGNVIKCPSCGIPLVLHIRVETLQCNVSTGEKLLCHRCSYKTDVPLECPKCQSARIKFSSPGTQGVEKEIAKLIGDEANIVRIDSDSLKTKKGINEILKNLQQESGVIIGTQIISKMWVPEKIDLIGLLYVDNLLNRPDFRASEKTFQIICELKSRLSESGRMIIQTVNPENKVIQSAAFGNYDEFYKEELVVRKQFNYPPFVRIINLTLYGRDMGKALREIDRIKKLFAFEFKNIEIMGPISPAAVKRGLFGKTLVLKISDWDEEMHLKLMGMIGEGWTVE